MSTVGFSGSRQALTPNQEAYVLHAVRALPHGTLVVTGACVGLDAFVAREAFFSGFRVKTILPFDRKAVDPDWAKYCHEYEEMPVGTTYKHRNARIVQLSDSLIAFPLHAEGDSLYSGTWQTVRMARRREMDVDVTCLDTIQ